MLTVSLRTSLPCSCSKIDPRLAYYLACVQRPPPTKEIGDVYTQATYYPGSFRYSTLPTTAGGNGSYRTICSKFPLPFRCLLEPSRKGFFLCSNDIASLERMEKAFPLEWFDSKSLRNFQPKIRAKWKILCLIPSLLTCCRDCK